MAQYSYTNMEGKLRKYILVLIMVMFSLFYTAGYVLAQSSVPSDPTTDTTLTDPNSADFSPNAFSSDFDSSSSASSDSSATADVTDNTATTAIPDTTPVTTVADTQTGPTTTIVFWLAFLASFGTLLVIKKYLSKKEVEYDYFK